MDDALKLPFYAKLAFILLSITAIFALLYVGQNIITPILLALLFAILLRPVSHFLKNKLHFPHVIAVMFTVTIAILIVFSIFYYISWQVSDIINDWGQIKANVALHVDTIQNMIRENFDLSKREQKNIFDSATEDSAVSTKSFLGHTLLSLTDTLLMLALVPIYTFLFLLYRTHFIKFLCKLFKPEEHTILQDILFQIKISVQSYITGILIETIAVSTLTTVGFMIIGVKYAIVLGVITGVLNLIPYIGILIAGGLSMVASLTTSPDISLIFGVVIVVVVVQLIDNNLLVPLIVSSKVQVNAFISIIGIVIGGALMGFTGMFLAIPFIAIFKVICDRIDSLKPWGYLMGDDLPKTFTWRHIRLPLYGSDSNDDNTQVNPPTFTATTTDHNQDI
ncbi:MAG: AI-2E family transporter [Bacteroidota bacterium]